MVALIRDGLSIRASFIVTILGLALYVVAIGSYIQFELAPAASSLRTRTAAMAAQYDSTTARTALLGDAISETRLLLTPLTGTATDLQSAAVLHRRLDRVVEESAGLRASLHLAVSPVIRAALAEASGAESSLAGSLVATLDYLGHGDRDAARRELNIAEGAWVQLITRLDETERLGLGDLSSSQRALGASANRITRAIAVWMVLGLGLLGLVLLAMHRWIYLPLAILDTGLARVADGEIETVLPVTRNDEFGRLTATFNQMTAVLQTRRDIDALRRSETRFRALIEQAPVAVLTSRDGVALYANETMARTFRLRGPRESVGLSLADFFATEYRGDASRRAPAPEHLSLSLPAEFKSVGLRADGTRFPMLVVVAQIVLSDGPADLYFMNDMSELDQVERQLHATTERMQLATQAAAIGIWDWDVVNNALVWDDVMYQLHGITRATFKGAAGAWSATIHPDDLAKTQEKIQAAMRGEGEYGGEYRVVWPDGSIHHAKAASQTLRDPARRPLRMVGIEWDVTDIREAESALRTEQANLEAIFESSPVGMLVLDESGNVVMANAALAMLTGGSREDILRHRPGNALSCIHSTSDPRGCGYAPACARCTGRIRIEALFGSGGSMHDVELPLELVRDGRPEKVWLKLGAEQVLIDGTRHLCVAMQDISSQKVAEAKLLDLLLDKEGLLKEVQHRVKNNLQVIASLLRLEGARSTLPAAKAVLDGMHGRVRSIARLHDTLAHSERYASVDLGAYLKGLAADVSRAVLTSPDAVKMLLDLTAVTVEMDQAMPCGLLVNELLSNGVKHGFPDGRRGQILIELHGIDDGRQLRLRISDTGVGLPPDFAARRENSLGLQLVTDMVKQLGGTLEIGPEPAATFTVTFPVKRSATAATPAS